MILPPEMGGRGARMTLQQSGHLTEWKILRADGSRILLVTDTDAANQY
ncbi:MAG: hypothetical protein Q4A32_00655 [Lachnospiraceae bacterium]|nr:hypothetical protein [Lachnospiraceae bacterium]